MDTSRVPPHSLEAESAVLGAAMLNADVLPHVAAVLAPAHFYRTGNGLLFAAMLELHGKGAPIDLVTATEALRRKGLLEKAGGAAYLSGLTNQVPSVENAEHYARTIREHANRRAVIAAAREAETAAFDGEEPETLRDRLYQAAASLTPGNARLADARTIGTGFLAALERAHEGAEPPGLTTGLPDLDRVVKLHPGDLVIVAGRPGMGKTSFALGITDANLRADRRVLWFSLEMTREALMGRLVAARSGVTVEDLRAGRVPDAQWGTVTRALGTLTPSGLFVDDTPGIGTAHVRAEAQRTQAAHGLDLVVVDYIGLMEEPGRWEARRLEIAKISRGLLRTAKELGVPLVLLCQLNRESENRNPPVPRLSDLRESGDLEQDADVVVLLNRPEAAMGTKCPPEKRGIAEIDVAKNRHGRTGVVEAWWHGPTTSFRSMEKGGTP